MRRADCPHVGERKRGCTVSFQTVFLTVRLMLAKCQPPTCYLCSMVLRMRLACALFVGISFVASWGLRTGHLLLHSEHHHALPCSARYDESNTYHLHDERYSADDCWVCAFWFATPDLPAAGPRLEAVVAETHSALPVFLETHTAAPLRLRRSRAPPAVAFRLAATPVGLPLA